MFTFTLHAAQLIYISDGRIYRWRAQRPVVVDLQLALAVFDLLDLVNVILPRFLSLAGDFQGQCVRLCPH